MKRTINVYKVESVSRMEIDFSLSHNSVSEVLDAVLDLAKKGCLSFSPVDKQFQVSVDVEESDPLIKDAPLHGALDEQGMSELQEQVDIFPGLKSEAYLHPDFKKVSYMGVHLHPVLNENDLNSLILEDKTPNHVQPTVSEYQESLYGNITKDKNGWVSVNDGLPLPNQLINVFIDWGNKSEKVDIRTRFILCYPGLSYHQKMTFQSLYCHQMGIYEESFKLSENLVTHWRPYFSNEDPLSIPFPIEIKVPRF